MTERDRQRIERGIGKQTPREPKKEIVYHICISITIYVFACQGEIGRMEDRSRVRQNEIAIGRENRKEKKSDKKRNGGRERDREIMRVKARV